jgi:hypothetical protein
MRFTFVRTNGCTTHYLSVGPRGVSLINKHNVSLSLSFAAGDNGVRLGMDLNAIYENAALDAHAKAKSLLDAIKRLSGQGWEYDRTLLAALLAAPRAPKAGIDAKALAERLDRLLTQVELFAPHLIGANEEVAKSRATLEALGLRQPLPAAAKAPRARRARKAPATA